MTFLATFTLKNENYDPLYSGGFLYIGQETDGRPGNPNGKSTNQISFDPQFELSQAFSGQVTQVELWNMDLSPSDIEKIATCITSSVRPDRRIVTWKSDSWIPTRINFIEIPLVDLCKRNTVSHQFIWPRSVSYEDYSNYCEAFDGIPPLVKPHYGGEGKPWKYIYGKYYQVFGVFKKEFPSTFTSLNQKYGRQCFSEEGDLRFWTGITRNLETTQWYSKYDFFNFTTLNMTIASENQRCVYIDAGKYRTADCADKEGACGICRISQDKIIYLKGLCNVDLKKYDIKYYIHGAKNNRPYFK